MANTSLDVGHTEREWAIPLTNSDYRSWSSDYRVVAFRWPGLRIKKNPILIDIAISVTKKYPDKSVRTIQGLSRSIYSLFKQVMVNDRVYGVTGKNKIDKSGTIVNIEFDNDDVPGIQIGIDWSTEWESIYVENLVSNKHGEFERVRSSKVISESLFKDHMKSVNEARNARPKINSIRTDNFEVSGSVDSREFTEPISRFQPSFETKGLSPKKDPGGIITLFYGTNRKLTGSTASDGYYGPDRGDLQYGTCDVSVPYGHIQGELERPFKMWIIRFDENPCDHIILRSIEKMDKSAFFDYISNRINETPQHDAVLFIHGYNTSFQDAAIRTAQIAWDIPFTGVSGFFSWPSMGKLSSYAYNHDDTNSQWSTTHLEAFISDFLTRTDVKRLHLIAHSLGNQLLTFTLQNIMTNGQLTNYLKVINQIVLGAPDIDRGIFKDQILPAIRNLGNRITMYSSDKDIALKYSDIKRLNLPRLGEAGNDLFVADGMDTIDASNVKDTLVGHSYIFDTKELLSDMFHLLQNGLDPVKRRLRMRRWKDQLVYWLFPE